VFYLAFSHLFFTCIRKLYIEPEYDLEIENIEDEGRISEIEINGDTVFSENVAYRPDA